MDGARARRGREGGQRAAVRGGHDGPRPSCCPSWPPRRPPPARQCWANRGSHRCLKPGAAVSGVRRYAAALPPSPAPLNARCGSLLPRRNPRVATLSRAVRNACCPDGARARLTCPLRPQARLALVVGVAPSRPQGVCRRRLRTLTGHRQPPCDRYGAAAGAAERRATAQRPSES